MAKVKTTLIVTVVESWITRLEKRLQDVGTPTGANTAKTKLNSLSAYIEDKREWAGITMRRSMNSRGRLRGISEHYPKRFLISSAILRNDHKTFAYALNWSTVSLYEAVGRFPWNTTLLSLLSRSPAY